MTEETFDLDAWLDGAKRTERSVTVYARPDLLADIDLVEKELRTLPAPGSDEDRAFGESDPAVDAQNRLDDLYIRLDASKLVLRVRSLTDEEQHEIREAAAKDLSEAMTEAAKTARAEAVKEAKIDGEQRTPADINELARKAARAAADAVLDREVSLRTIAEAITTPKMTLEQVKNMYRKLGDAQMMLVQNAYMKASLEAPQVQVPKLQKP